MVGFKQVTLLPGQFVFGRKQAAEDLNTTESKIRTAVKTLTKLRCITIESTNEHSIITVINWDAYQSPESEVDQQGSQRVTSRSPAGHHKQECKKEIMQKNKQDIRVTPDKTLPDPVPPLTILKEYCRQNENGNIKHFMEAYERYPQHEHVKTEYNLRRKLSPGSTFSKVGNLTDKKIKNMLTKKMIDAESQVRHKRTKEAKNAHR